MTKFPEIRTGIGYDIHPLKANRSLIIGGIQIPHHSGFMGHSDADVLTHAICDALLGAAALGDIGSHFPDNDDNYKNINSLILLKKVCELLKQEKFVISNIDATLILEKPKILKYNNSIRESLSECMNLPINRISVKATTHEKMDSTGREEAGVAIAIATIIRDSE